MSLTHAPAPGLDAHGNPTAGDHEAIATYDLAVDRLVRYHPAVVDHAVGLVTETPDFAMGQVLMAYLSLTLTDRPDLDGARDAAAQLHQQPLAPRELAHRAVIDRWLAGDWRGAARHLDDLLQLWPADLLALLVGHQLDFFIGDATNLRDRIGRSLHAFDPADPHHGFVLGMQAFGLEEAGSYAEAEAAGRAALERNRDDVWATHAITHTFEMRGMVVEGMRFLHEREDDWGRGNLFTVHNWWHLALFLLEAGRVDDVLAIYDREVHHVASSRVPLEMLDASALLWRLLLDGEDSGIRFAALADAWASRVVDAPWYVFNDVHAVMAMVGAGRLAEARAVIERLAADVEGAGYLLSPSQVVTAEVGLPVSQAMLAFGEGRYAEVVASLVPVRRTLARFGGSHAQRDVVQRTLLEAALRDGQLDLARALASERLSVRPASVYGWQREAAVLAGRGDRDGAGEARRRAEGLRAAFAAAAG